MKKIVLLSLLILPAVLLASGGDAESSRYFAQTGRETDFWPRVFNFVIFASLLYYLLANPIKNFFKGRTEGISAQLNEIEKKLQAAKDEKKDAQNRLDESAKRAEEIIVDAKAEAVILAEKIATANQNDLAVLD
ncbi:MAG: F0F1 ATP synthase subunit B, partial [Sulfurovum sp.]|nr:F0F1 ATP synthase subunit B [Sulfurovum sp.]